MPSPILSPAAHPDEAPLATFALAHPELSTLEFADVYGVEAFAQASGPVMNRAGIMMAALFEHAGVDATHGYSHAVAVCWHANEALEVADPPVAPARQLAVILAALLHDVDDRKYFPDTCTTYAHAARIMEAAGAPAVVTAEALYMISLVSCSANGNTVPATVADRPELLYPRWADRLEAVGDRGVMRCVQYSYKARTPIALESTPRPDSDAGILAAATAERFAAYQAGAPSASIVDHFYDKLIHVALTPPWLVRNAYLEKEAAGRAEPILAACRAYSAGGQDAAGQYFEQLAAKMGERLDE